VWGPLPGADCRGCSWSLMSALDVSGTAVAQGRAPMARPAGRPTATRRVGRCTSTAPDRSVDHRPPARRARGHQTHGLAALRADQNVVAHTTHLSDATALSRSNLGEGSTLGWYTCHLRGMVRGCAWLSAVIRRRCHAVRHSSEARANQRRRPPYRGGCDR
jgi:hypothetical protein